MTSQPLRKSILSAFASFVLLMTAVPALLGQGAPPDAPAPSTLSSQPVIASASSPPPVVFPSVVSSATSSSSALNSSGAAAPAIASTVLATPPPGATERPHRFFDKWNIALFTGSAALDSADFAVTRANLQTTGGKELNPIVRMFGHSTAGLAFNFAGEAAGTVGLSYFFHKTGHYKLERAVSLVNIGGSGAAVTYSSTHR